MKLLHLFSNFRWTGPAEPTVNLAAALQRAGWDVTFACSPGPRHRKSRVAQVAAERDLPVCTDLRLNKHRHPLHNFCDARRLRRWLAAAPFDLVHATLRNAHLVAAAALRRSVPHPLLVRTCFDGDGPQGFVERRLLRPLTDGLIVVSERARRRAVEQLGFPADRVWAVHTAVDLARFDPDRIEAATARQERRRELGIPPDAFVVGIIARIQWRRRYDVFLQALRLARRELPRLHGLIVGRGTHMDPITVEPIRTLGLQDAVTLPGYHGGDDYVRTIAAMDVKVYLVPGTDGSCRAVREAMALGVPVIAARRGMLPELMGPDERGLAIDDTPENLAAAMLSLARDEERRAALGRAARRFALDHFALDRQAEEVGRIYRTLAEKGPR